MEVTARSLIGLAITTESINSPVHRIQTFTTTNFSLNMMNLAGLIFKRV